MATIPKEIKQKASRLVEVDKAIGTLNEEKSVLLSEIMAYMKQEELKVLPVSGTSSKQSIVLSERVSITYDISKLKEKLDPEVFKQVIRKEYMVNDFQQLVKLVAKFKVPKSDFLKLVSSIAAVDRNALNKLYDIGEITAKDLQGCYTVSVSNSLKLKDEVVGK
jgi:hypothetical protein